MRWSFRPLDVWPGRATQHRRSSQFSAGYVDTLNLLAREVEQLGADAAVVQLDLTEAEIRLDGIVRSSARPRSPGVIVSFEGRSGPLRFSCDRFSHWHENLRAIALGLEALRKVDRYGIVHGAEQYAGFRALGSGEVPPFLRATTTRMSVEYAEGYVRQLAGVGNDVDIRSAYRRAAKSLHPDTGGDAQQFQRLQEAMEVIERFGS